MKNYLFAALAALSLLFGTVALTTPASASVHTAPAENNGENR